MAKTNSSSTSEQIASLNAQIVDLLREEIADLEEKLANAKAQLEAAEGNSGGAAASAPAPSTRPAKKKGKRGRPPGKKKPGRPAGKQGGAKKRGGRRPRANAAERMGAVKELVQSAGNDGISALQVAEKTDFPYAAVREILNDKSTFKKVGEKRNSRFFLK